MTKSHITEQENTCRVLKWPKLPRQREVIEAWLWCDDLGNYEGEPEQPEGTIRDVRQREMRFFL